MIIIAENKYNHKLIKNFLIENNNFIDDLGQDQGGLHKVLDTKIISQDETIDKDSTLFNTFIKEKPKFKGIKKFAIIPLIALASLYSNNLDKAAVEFSKSNDITPVAAKELILDEEDKEIAKVDYDTFVDYDEVVKKIIDHEGFDGLPYLDHHQWSIGHGTKVYSSADLGEGEHERLKADYKKKSKRGMSRAKWIETTIPGWREKFFAEYNISSDKKSKHSPVSQDQAAKAAKIRIKIAISEMEKIQNFEKLPENVKRAFFDMAYNMGSGFLNKFVRFDEAIKFAISILSSSSLNLEEVKVANKLFSLAADEILYNYNPDGSKRGDTKYHKDLKKSGRPQRNARLVRRGIENPKQRFEFKNFQNESLKKVYNYLFI